MKKVKELNFKWNHKRVYRVYCEMQLNIKIKPKKRIPSREQKALVQPLKSNVCWSIDFMSDGLMHGKKFRTLNVMDDYNRECLMIEPSFTLPAIRVTGLLDRIAEIRGYPEMIRVDNGPEFISKIFKNWAEKKGVLIHYIQPGKPAQNGFIERFNRSYREEILDLYWFKSLEEVKEITEDWLKIYNNERPHESLNNQAPIIFKQVRENILLNGKINVS
jgi:putative transposase